LSDSPEEEDDDEEELSLPDEDSPSLSDDFTLY
jgi:hypothetical protein